jgi:hypothetical protein
LASALDPNFASSLVARLCRSRNNRAVIFQIRRVSVSLCGRRGALVLPHAFGKGDCCVEYGFHGRLRKAHHFKRRPCPDPAALE